MYTQLLPIIVPILVCVLVGYLWARSPYPFEHEFLARIVMNVGAPCLVLNGMTSLSSGAAQFHLSFWIAVGLIGFCALLGSVVLAFYKQPFRSYLPPIMFGNMGNLGVPLCAFAFGDEGLGLAIGFYIAGSVIQFVVGPMIQGQQAAWRTLLTSPIIYAALLGFALLQMQVSMPLPLSNTIELISGVTLPMMLIAMGYSLATFSFSRFGFAFGLTALRFMLGLSAGFFVVWWLELEGTLRGVVIIEASMPVAIFNYLFAARYDRDPEDIASAILISTLISLLTLPWLLLFALGEL